jgi:ATP-dependent RNA helicase DDX24/MAK5
MSKAKEIDNWREFDVCEALCNSLVANKFKEPTTVQKESLVYLNAHTDMVIAAKTGQGKTLTFGIPILDLLLRRLSKFGHEDDEFDSVKALIMAPTRELTIQIKEHIEAIVPSQNAKQIKVCAIVGGMSIQKQLRLLSYKPTIIVATPGRLWELMSDHNNDYLNKGLPLIDVLVLDEADRMIADGHFKEMRDILAHIYTSRVSIKRPKKEGDDKVEEVKLSEQYKECVELGDEFFVSKHSTRPDIDLSKV